MGLSYKTRLVLWRAGKDLNPCHRLQRFTRSDRSKVELYSDSVSQIQRLGVFHLLLERVALGHEHLAYAYKKDIIFE